MKFIGLVIISVVIQTIVNMLKEAFPPLKEHRGIIFALCTALGILCCIAFDGDIFATYEMTSTIPYLGHILTGVCCGGGSSIIYDIVKGDKGRS